MAILSKSKLLIVDDDQLARDALAGLLADEYEIVAVSSGKAAIEVVQSQSDIATVIMDIKMPGMDGITAARSIRMVAPLVPVIFHTGYPGDYDEDELDATETPFDYIEKAGPVSRLLRSVRNAIEAYRSRIASQELTVKAERDYNMIGQSRAMQAVYRLIAQVSRTDARVMILGETGTGKELVARAIHAGSARFDRRLAIFNCNHKSPDLVESELFGHLKGAFTGAIADRIGLFAYADGGTVFLDEIGDLDITTQAKVLRVIETGEFHPLGSPEIIKTDVRLLCATHRNLEKMVTDKEFREDLYYRLNAVRIQLPPLRERKEDIPMLAHRFIDKYTIDKDLPVKILDQGALDELIAHEWPGNVRHLQNSIEALVVTTDSDIIVANDVRRYFEMQGDANQAVGQMSLTERMKEFRKALIIQTLRETENNISAAARKLGVDRANLRKIILDHGIDVG
ncbi:MAG: sigma-54 dependent transcriptional regulator [Candidatus Zixiibacteriota bacterium]